MDAAQHRPDPVVTIDSGAVRGRWRGPSAAFLGIPFAAAPVGPLRFAAPAPVAGWDGIRDAATFGPTPQRRPLAPLTRIPEPSIPGDATLNVNVFTPAPDEPDARLPVLVWIHGGGYTAGSPASSWWDGASFNARGVVTVSISYRLGFTGYGWLEGAPTNRAVLDQIAALEWVHRNIAAFGGDPAKVTIAGQSAGGGSALTLLVTPRARGLFRAVIAQSAAVPDLTLDAACTLGQRLADAAGVPATAHAWQGVAEERLLDLEGQALAESMRAMMDLGGLVDGSVTMALPFGPVWGDGLLPETLEAGLREGGGIPLLVGANLGELAPEVLTDPLRAERLAPGELEGLGVPAPVVEHYRRTFPEHGMSRLIGQLTTDLVFRVPLTGWARIRTETTADSPTWLYEFDWPAPVSGASLHCSELPFVWDCLGGERVADLLGDAPPAGLAAEMHTAWTAFVTDLDPGWPRYATPDRAGRVFDTVSRTVADVHGDARELAALLRP